ncbi:MAG: hypothetical protein M0P61_10125 [Ignavibacteriaceae bacterium]|jgi:hypothetical protein|nr:hypothetical protein [Ignavibacteriaceae bacterium]
MFSEKFTELVLELGLSESEGFDYKIKSDGVEIMLPSCSTPLKLNAKNIEVLYSGKKPLENHKFRHHYHCGFSFEDYAEFLIQFHYSDYSPQSWEDLWLHDEKFIFHIDKYDVEISKASPYFILFLGNYYSDMDPDYEHISRSATIKIKNLENTDPEDILNQALYYLISSILNKMNLSVSIRHLSFDDDYTTVYGLKAKLTKTFKQKTKKKIINDNTEPLVLFNYASTLNGENQFLGFYRVLEYYFDRCKLNKIKEYRYNNLITDEELIKHASTKNEREYLKVLVNEIVDSNTKIKICKIAFDSMLVKNDDLEIVVKELYDFRNSIVHSRESRIEDTEIPNPFDIYRIELIKNWCKIVKVLSNMAIIKFNNL